MKILIVDDSKAMRMLVKRSLRMAGFGDHETIEAENGKEGVAAVDAQQPDLVISDWNMPEMTGLEFLQTLRANECNVNFGFVTTEASDEMRALAKEPRDRHQTPAELLRDLDRIGKYNNLDADWSDWVG